MLKTPVPWRAPRAPFESPSDHGYDTVDYETIERDYGTNAVFQHFLRQPFGIAVRTNVLMKLTTAAFLLSLTFAAATTVPAQLAPGASIALDTSVPMPPTPVLADGKLQLGYELHVTNFRGAEVTLGRIDVLDDDGATLLSVADLPPILGRPGMKPDADKRVLTGGTRAIAFLWVTVDRAPKTLRHRITYTLGGAEASVTTTAVIVRTEPAVAIAPALKGDRWVASYGPSNTAPHRRTILPIGGAARIPQRFATDWIRVGPEGQVFHGDIGKNENWYAYGAEVFAVADGVVVGTRDGIADNVPPNLTPGGTIEDAGGNHVILDLGRGRYAFFAHLQPGSVRVKTGDRVKRGQVLGHVGNSGNSLGAHLHFHISTDPLPLATEGLPYVLTSFVEIGRVESSESLEEGKPWLPRAGFRPVTHRGAMPVGEMVVRFE